MSEKNIQEAVKEKYGAAARQVTEGKTACCGGGATLSGCDPITRNLYDETRQEARCPPMPSPLPLVAAIPPPSPN